MRDSKSTSTTQAAGRARAAGFEVEWRRAAEPVSYPEAVAFMEERVRAIRAGEVGELVWLIEHPPLYTAGTSARVEDLIDPDYLPVYRSGRGGQYTYHGPGQRIAYVMLDLARRKPDIRAYVAALEGWVIAALADFGVRGERRAGRVGIWVETSEGEAKIAAIGVRVRRWITFHGISINVAPDLAQYRGIVACGIRDRGVTSLAALGIEADMAMVDAALERHFGAFFGE